MIGAVVIAEVAQANNTSHVTLILSALRLNDGRWIL